MSRLSALTTTWETVKEIDLQPLREEALSGVKLAFVGAQGTGRRTLADLVRRDPAREGIASDVPVMILDLNEADQAGIADLIVLLLDSRRTDFTREADLSRIWSGAGKPVLVCINRFDQDVRAGVLQKWVDWKSRRVVEGSIQDSKFLTGKFALAVIDLLPADKLLALGRFFPLFRVPIANHLINDTCFTNAAYSFSTGIVEIVPVLNIPLTVTDMFVLSKNQAFLVYKLGLALGLSTRWQDYLAEFSSVLGGGFLFRQLARSLVSLIPLWGILPKVSIAYAGTFVIGHAILQWYLTGKHLSPKQMREIYRSALGRGREYGRRLISNLPRPRIKRPRVAVPKLPRSRLRRERIPRKDRRKLKVGKKAVICPHCGRRNVKDAIYCQYCGERMSPGYLQGAGDSAQESSPSEAE